MRRFLRRLLRIITPLSILLSLVVLAFWVRSYWVEDRFEETTHHLRAKDGLDTLTVKRFSARGKLVQEIELQELTQRSLDKRPGPIIPPIGRKFGSRSDPVTTQVYGRSLLSWLGFEDSTAIGCGSLGSFTHRRTVISYELVLFAAVAPALVRPFGRAARAGWLKLLPILAPRKMRIRAGLCVRCGYDLRATQTRCPECGSIPTSADTASSPP